MNVKDNIILYMQRRSL